MTCKRGPEIARAATTGELDAHFAACLACRRDLEEQRATRAQLARLPIPMLSTSHRSELAAETLARAEHLPIQHRSWLWPAGLITIAAAATVAVVIGLVQPRAAPDDPLALTPTESASAPERVIARETSPPPLPSPQIAARPGTTMSQRVGDARDLVTLVDGTIAIDTRAARNVDVQIGRAVVRVDDASVQIRASGGKIVSLHVIVGSARLASADEHVIVERDSIWVAEPASSERSVRGFREGWIALRAGRNREAIELFDAATDASVAEEATYWAAIAAKRAGDDEGAQKRFADFVQRFPTSPYIEQGVAVFQVR